ncbi:formimidoylglutamase [bacterium]|nr:formimidoylglutamase [bacterium]
MKLWGERLVPPDGAYFVGGHDVQDVKMGQVVRAGTSEGDVQGADAVILGFPTDQGVARNHGRVGAAFGPKAIREAFYRLNAYDAERDLDLSSMKIVDIGDIKINGRLEEEQEHLGAIVARLLKMDIVPVVLGGGHETTYGHFLGYVEDVRRLGIVNVDAHLDVREPKDGQPTSGTSFRMALQHPSGALGGRYTCLGAHPHANSKKYTEWVKAQGGRIHWLDELRRLGLSAPFGSALASYRNHDILVTFDMDAVSSSFAPGTSAAQPIGLTGFDLVMGGLLAGENKSVRSLDIVEVAPPLDRDNQTARLASLILHSFLVGLAFRVR